jgi:sortase A
VSPGVIIIKIAEWLSWGVGVAALGFFLSHMAMGEVERTSDIQAFEMAYAGAMPDQSLWSPQRITAYEEVVAEGAQSVRAVLSIPDLGLEVPVYSDSSHLNMDRGAGLIPGTATPVEAGNIGIAGHRDGYFRVLKDAQVGSPLILQTPVGERRYRISEIMIVDPLDVEVLDSGEQEGVTLVTCYPFYFVGSAPKRYIVKAQIDGTYVNE